MTLPRFYPILDTATLERRGMELAAAAGAILEGGAQILQFRHKGHFSRAHFAAAEQIAAMCRDAGAQYVIDDRADIAVLLGAGLHLGQEDLPPALARRVAGVAMRIGFSTHNGAQLRAAAGEPVDYLAIGPVFRTGSKQNPDPVVGTEQLRSCRPLAPLPLVAIGGITRDNAQSVLDAGADSVAIIGDIYPADLNRRTLRERIEEWQTLLSKK